METEVTFYGRQNAELSCISPKLPRGAQGRKAHGLDGDLCSNGMSLLGPRPILAAVGLQRIATGREGWRASREEVFKPLQPVRSTHWREGGGRGMAVVMAIPGILVSLPLSSYSLTGPSCSGLLWHSKFTLWLIFSKTKRQFKFTLFRIYTFFLSRTRPVLLEAHTLHPTHKAA